MFQVLEIEQKFNYIGSKFCFSCHPQVQHHTMSMELSLDCGDKTVIFYQNTCYTWSNTDNMYCSTKKKKEVPR